MSLNSKPPTCIRTPLPSVHADALVESSLVYLLFCLSSWVFFPPFTRFLDSFWPVSLAVHRKGKITFQGARLSWLLSCSSVWGMRSIASSRW